MGYILNSTSFFLIQCTMDNYLNESLNDMKKQDLAKQITQMNREIGIEPDYEKKKVMLINRDIKQYRLKIMELMIRKEQLKRNKR
jgi:hypothetical protein